MPDQEELVGGIALVEQILPGIETVIARAAGDELAELRLQAGEERMRQDDAFKSFHGRASLVCRRRGPDRGGLFGVMSMPTGHQVMQRPQPTQPEVPNWSIQLASLCVIHCR